MILRAKYHYRHSNLFPYDGVALGPVGMWVTTSMAEKERARSSQSQSPAEWKSIEFLLFGCERTAVSGIATLRCIMMVFAAASPLDCMGKISYQILA